MCDLHRGNIIINEKGPVVIDLETALLPTYDFNTTGLIDTSSEAMKWATGFAEVFELSREPECKFDINLFLDGFNEVLQWSLNNQNKLSQFFKENRQEITRADNRFILRNSREYENHKNKFIPEEILQLERGDVPYFLTHRNEMKIFYKTSIKDKDNKSVKRIPNFSKKLLMLHGASIHDVISIKRIKFLLKNGPEAIRNYFCVN